MHTTPKIPARDAAVRAVPRSALVLVAVLAGGCGKAAVPEAGAAAADVPSAQSGAAAVAAQQPPAAGHGSAALATATASAPAGSLAARAGELSNPDDTTMVYLYYDLAGIAPPIDRWVEDDANVRFAPAAERAERRVAAKAAFEAGMAAVRGVGVLQLTTNAQLSQYDPGYGEFTIGALSPASMFTFKAMDQTIQLKLDNALAAQSWSVPADRAQAITDRIGYSQVALDVTLKIDKVLPSPGGGTIVARALAWTLRNEGDGTILGRGKVP